MKSIKVVLPWLLAVVALVGVYVTYSSSRAKETELATLQQEVQELQKLKAEIAELKNAQVSSDELERLRKANADLPRLRNEVSKLRDENQKLTKQIQAAPRVDPQQVQQLQTEVQQLRNQSQQLQQTSVQQAQINGCINNLRQIDGAKQQWALENQKAANALVNQTELLRYFKENAMPVCPAGGAYTLNTVGIAPTCNIPGHVIPK